MLSKSKIAHIYDNVSEQSVEQSHIRECVDLVNQRK